MQSSFRVIKNNSVINQGLREVVTNDFVQSVESKTTDDDASKSILESYENIGKSIIENARRQSDSMISKAMEDAQKLERDAYEKGYRIGLDTGLADGKAIGYKEAYEDNIERAMAEAQMLIQNANDILFNAKKEYENYLAEKQKEIVGLSIYIAETVLKKQLATVDGIDNMVFSALEQSRNAKTFIIKTNSIHLDNIKAKVYDWKEKLALGGEVFVIADDTINVGNAVIEKDNGKIIVGIDTALNNIRLELK